MSVALRFLQSFDAAGRHNLVAFDPTLPRAKCLVDARTFAAAAHPAIEQWISDHKARDHNMYFSANEPTPDARHTKLLKKDIGAIRAVYADLDPRDGQDLDSERDRLAGVVADMHQILAPSFVIDSGGGYQPFWRVETVPATDENRRLAEDAGAGIASRFGGDAVHNVDRIMRLPGTDNIPDAAKQRRGRVRRVASLVDLTGMVYPLAAIASAFPIVGERRSDIGDGWRTVYDQINLDGIGQASRVEELPDDLRQRFGAALDAQPNLRALWERGQKKGADTSGSAYVASLGFSLYSRGFAVNDFAQLAWVWPFAEGRSGRHVNASPRQVARIWSKASTPKQGDSNTRYGPQPNGHDPAALEQLVAATLGGITSLRDLRTQTFAPLKCVIGELVTEGLTMLAAAPKAGKSTMMFDCCRAVAEGDIALGRQCEKGDSLYLSLEMPDKQVQRFLTKMWGANQGEWPSVDIKYDWPRAHQGGIECLRAWAKSKPNAKMVVIDSFQKFRELLGEKIATYETEYDAIDALHRLAHELAIAIVVIYHTRKAESESGNVLDKILGSRGLQAPTDAAYVLDKSSGGKYSLAGTSREAGNVDLALEFDEAARRWKVLGERGRVERRQNEEAVLAALKSAKAASLSPADLIAMTSLSKSTITRLLLNLRDAGTVDRDGHGRYSLPGRLQPPQEEMPFFDDA